MSSQGYLEASPLELKPQECWFVSNLLPKYALSIQQRKLKLRLRKEERFMRLYHKAFTLFKDKRGLSIKSWGIQAFIRTHLDIWPFETIVWYQLRKKR